MSIFRVMAGYTYGHADVVRRAMSKKKGDVLMAERASFLEGAAKNGVDEKTAVKLFDDMSTFANYAFNKSHAAAYAVISYRTAYLKQHYPCEYMAALMTSVLGNLTKLAEYISATARVGRTQFILATHSPVFLARKEAKIYNLDSYPASVCRWTELPNVRKYFDFFMEHKHEFER